MDEQTLSALDTERLLQDTRGSIIFGLMIASLGIGLAMIALSREPAIALNVGGTMFAITATILMVKSLSAWAWLRTAPSYKSDYAALLRLRAHLLGSCYRQAAMTASAIALSGWVLGIMAGLLH
ncbi:MAG: hypothetical protein AAF213_06595 [Pseudomonadota bacterium]